VWSEKGSKIHKVASGCAPGVVWANTYNQFDPEGGRHGLLPYLEIEA
jgi:hypothetical protein